ncbi:serine hydrolase domain-containing protein [Teredinibacter franksiae]|uniref:serine hydrolase domain-containing protein n=1 Tax=Teredinibacter franksiae TaxID=2761453 RepID=UPI001629C0F4|nr:serine hydrolase domain-containing protein [Teredinibacter franksiae]
MRFWIRIVVILISAVPLLANAEGTAHSISTSVVREFISTINENNKNKTKQYISDNYYRRFLEAFPLDNHLNHTFHLHDQNGGLGIESISRIDDKRGFIRWSALVKSERTEAWSEFIVWFSADKPEKIAGIQMRPASLSGIPDVSKNISQGKLKKELKSYLKRAAKKNVFSGTVLLAKGDRVIFTGAAGLADKRFDVPNNTKTKFNLASMSKMFTAVAIMRLVEVGKLHLDDQLNKFIDESWLSPEISQKIQIKHLLSHTSGLGSFLNNTYEASAKDSFRDLDDYKILIKDETLKFEPGAAYSYSNTGMFLLGLVIENVSGEDYFDYIRKHIYMPAGMANSGSFDMDQPTSNLATGYYFRDGWKNNRFLLSVKGGPAGGGYSTAEDLYKFTLALINNRLLGKKFTEQLFVINSELNAVNYGYGFRVFGEKNHRIVGHDGAFDGISTNLDVFLDQGYIAIVLSNYSQGAPPFVQKMRLLIAQATNEK